MLGADATMTREEVAAAAGITVEQARPFWRAMGFPDVGQARIFTASDLAMLQLIDDWVGSGLIDSARAVEIVRGIGQSTSRLADWQATTMARVLADTVVPDTEQDAADVLDRMLPGLEAMLVHSWRRHLANLLGRVLGPGSDLGPDGEPALVTVGFADMAGFTRLVRIQTEEELAETVESFEAGASDLVAQHGARLVKTIGDEVMFVAEEAATAVAIATAMHTLRGPRDTELKLRIGLSTGRLVALMGDYYGDTANRASRLTAVARPGVTLIDPATEEALGQTDRYLVRHHRLRALRGLGLVRVASVVARPEGANGR